MAGGLHLVGVFFAFAAFALMVIVTVSAPIWNSVAFLTTLGGTKLGVFGYVIAGVKSPKMYGYHLIITGSTQSVVTHWLTYALIANPIAALVLLFALVFGLGTNFCLGLMGSLLSFLGFFVTVIALAFDLGLAIEAKRRINATGQDTASIGKAIWFVVAAAGSALIASLLVCCTHTRRTRNKRESAVLPEDNYYNHNSNAYDNETNVGHNNGAPVRSGTIGTHHSQHTNYESNEPVMGETNHAGQGAAGSSWWNKRNANNTTAY